jgi:hypothetical protein
LFEILKFSSHFCSLFHCLRSHQYRFFAHDPCTLLFFALLSTSVLPLLTALFACARMSLLYLQLRCRNAANAGFVRPTVSRTQVPRRPQRSQLHMHGERWSVGVAMLLGARHSLIGARPVLPHSITQELTGTPSRQHSLTLAHKLSLALQTLYLTHKRALSWTRSLSWIMLGVCNAARMLTRFNT